MRGGYCCLECCAHHQWRFVGVGRYLTIIQISQFVATLIPSIIVLGSRIVWTLNPNLAYPVSQSAGAATRRDEVTSTMHGFDCSPV
jgi:hypothetical protein